MGCVWILLPAFLCPQPTDRSGGWASVECSSLLLSFGGWICEQTSATRKAPWAAQTGKRMHGVVTTHLSYKRASLFLRSSSHSLRLSR